MGRPPKKRRVKKGGNGAAGVPETPLKDVEEVGETGFPILSPPMSGEYIAAQLRQAAKSLYPVISNLDQQKSELLLKEVEKIAEKLRSLANLIFEAVALGSQKNLFEALEKLPAMTVTVEADEPKLAKTLFSKESPDKKALAAGDRPEATP